MTNLQKMSARVRELAVAPMVLVSLLQAPLQAMGSQGNVGAQDRHVSMSQLSEDIGGDTAFHWNGGALVAPRHGIDPKGVLTIVAQRDIAKRSLCKNDVTLIGPSGPAKITTNCVSGGLMVFPAQPLLPGQNYTLLTKSSQSRFPQAVAFRTKNILAEQSATTPMGGLEEWQPDLSRSLLGWRYGGSDHAQYQVDMSADVQVGAVQTEATTANTFGSISGQLLRFNGEPLKNVKVSVGKQASVTDLNGVFELNGINAGVQALTVDGTGVVIDGGHYTKHILRVTINGGKATKLSQPIYLARVDPGTEVAIASPTDREVVLTHPNMPGLEVRIPKGVVLREQDGSLVTKVSLTPVPIDRAPYPVPTNFSIYFTLQPGGAYVDDAKGRAVQITYPNYQGIAANLPVDFWNYDTTSGWQRYGKGRVSSDGKTIVADAGAQASSSLGLRQLMTFGYGFSNAVPTAGPVLGGARDGEPVDMATGIFITSRTDIAINDVLPISVSRTYQQMDTQLHAFGVGWNIGYDMHLASSQSSRVNLVLPDGTLVPFCATGANYVANCSGAPGGYWYGATLSGVTDTTYVHALQWQIKTLDQTVYRFDGDAPNPLLNITDGNGNRVDIARGPGTNAVNGNITKVTSPNGRFIKFTYDATNKLIVQAIDNIGRVTNYVYDASSRLSKVYDSDQTTLDATKQVPIIYSYDGNGRLYTITDKRGNVVLTNVYNSATDARIKQQTMADNTTWGYAYSPTLQPTGVPVWTNLTNPRGIVTQYQFNAQGYPVKKIVAMNATSVKPQTYSYALDANNQVATITDPLGRVTNLGRDERGNITSVTRLANDPSKTISQWLSYDPSFNKLSSYTNELNQTTSVSYDDRGNLSSVSDPLNNYWGVVSNDQGLPQQILSPLGNSTSMSYRLADLASVTDPNGSSFSYGYDDVGRAISAYDPAGNLSSSYYDNLDRPTDIQDAAGNTTSLSYDNNGNLARVLLAGHTNPYKFGYDARNNNVSEIDPLGRSRFVGVYDGNKNLTQGKDGNSALTKYILDELDRIKEVDFADASSVKFGFDDANRLTSATDSLAGNTSVTWDVYDHPTSVVTPYGTVGYSFDSIGRVKQTTYPSGLAVAYTYDAANRLSTLKLSTDVNPLTIALDGEGKLSTLSYPNGAVRTNLYSKNRLASISYSGANIATPLSWLYSYDMVGRISAIDGTLSNYRAPTPLTATYDDANQITARNGLIITSDGNGSQLNDTGLSFQYNARGDLSTLTGSSGTATYMVNPFGLRDTKTVRVGTGASTTTTTTHYVYDLGGHLIAEVDASNKTQKEYIWAGDIPVMLRVYATAGVTSTAVTYNIYTDHLNTPRVVTDLSNHVVWTWNPDVYGNGQPTETGVSMNLRFPGQYYDAESGLHYNAARYYNPATGRYTQSDPIGLAGGINTYGYVSGDPLNYSDPEGLLAQGIVDFGAGMGDVLLLGQGQRLRDLLGVDGGVDQCSSEYSAGEWAGIAGSFATGLVGGVKAAGVKAAGMEFSHAIPARVFRPSSKSYSATLDAAFGWAEKTILNGNYVTPLRHYLHDPFRYPKGWRDFGEKLPSWLQQLDRIPNVFKGGAAGAAYGAAGSAMNGCTCK